MVPKNPGPRNRTETEGRILSAVQTLIAREGFAGLTIKAVAQEAGIDKVLIYRYFGKIDDLMAVYAASTDFWPTVDEVLSPDNDRLPADERLYAFFDRFIAALKCRPLTVDILVMENATANPLTDALNQARERWSEDLGQRLMAGEAHDFERFNIVSSLISAGIQYLFIRARGTKAFSTIPIDDDDGWDRIRVHLKWLCTRLIENPVPKGTFQ